MLLPGLRVFSQPSDREALFRGLTTKKISLLFGSSTVSRSSYSSQRILRILSYDGPCNERAPDFNSKAFKLIVFQRPAAALGTEVPFLALFTATGVQDYLADGAKPSFYAPLVAPLFPHKRHGACLYVLSSFDPIDLVPPYGMRMAHCQPVTKYGTQTKVRAGRLARPDGSFNFGSTDGTSVKRQVGLALSALLSFSSDVRRRLEREDLGKTHSALIPKG
ncbi:hypothetical protein GYMLUDRAFT_244390 [Collybiopsis luxurians FD-317 M1]|uniref:Unplaced genomic scaffold GYMLUscaffold_27, whole genome shotgun sequence n=1 Tax=Collybiopsis luxurians FD-317 M1 TaxID=944289 RepID=A0A0D0CNP4_9AGAR|nr:hypothetical protein GYMLUDRAFT_244390 [Collybiopsis luxurians FD-317 M1]